MRIIAGLAAGRRLKNIKKSTVRPTQDRVKESLFNMLAPYLPETKVLDLYAGFGGLGLEALSRGALSATFIEKSYKNKSFNKLLYYICYVKNINFYL